MTSKLFSLILLFLAVDAWAAPEICGDGRDNDSSGGDAVCGDAIGCTDDDRDGYCTNGLGPNAGTDCDDTNRFIYPDPAVGTQSGCTGGQAKFCQSDGTYTACEDACPSDCLACYYIATTGSNSNAGTFAAPWLNQIMFNSHYSGGTPAGWRNPTAGDCFIFRGGTYTTEFHYGGGGANNSMIVLSNEDGNSTNPIRVMGYPGETVVFDPSTSGVVPFRARSGSDYIKLSNITFTGATCGTDWQTDAGCVSFVESANGEAYNLTIYDVDGTSAGSNPGGLYIHSMTTMSVHHNKLYDTRALVSGDNHSLLLYFRGSNYTIADNLLYQTNTADAALILNKHGNDNSSATIARNVFDSGTISFASPNVNFINNLLHEAPLFFGNLGGPNFQQDIVVRRNTFYNSRFIAYNPEDSYNSSESNVGVGLGVAVGQFTADYNVIVDDAASYPGNAPMFGMWSDGTEGPDCLYTAAWSSGLTDLNYNCYYNSAATTLKWAIFPSNNGNTSCSLSQSGNSGADYSGLAAFQAVGQDANSYAENPNIASDTQVAGASNCLNKGWNIGLGSSVATVKGSLNYRGGKRL